MPSPDICLKCYLNRASDKPKRETIGDFIIDWLHRKTLYCPIRIVGNGISGVGLPCDVGSDPPNGCPFMLEQLVSKNKDGTYPHTIEKIINRYERM